jgi:hypothetical protein
MGFLPLETPACPAHLRHPTGPAGWSLHEVVVEEEEGEGGGEGGAGVAGRRAAIIRARAGWVGARAAPFADAAGSFVVKACLVGDERAAREAVRPRVVEGKEGRGVVVVVVVVGGGWRGGVPFHNSMHSKQAHTHKKKKFNRPTG